MAAVELALRTEELVERGILKDRGAEADAATLAELLDEGRARPATETQRQLCRRVDAALPAARVRAAPALDPAAMAVLKRLARDFPDAVKLAELLRDTTIPSYWRSPKRLDRELRKLREMSPPLAAQAAHGYHVATEAGARRAKGR